MIESRVKYCTEIKWLLKNEIHVLKSKKDCKNTFFVRSNQKKIMIIEIYLGKRKILI